MTRALTFSALLFLGPGVASAEGLQDSSAWSVDSEPRLRVGWLADRPEMEFFGVVAATLLPGGAIAIADRGLAMITVVEADGSVRFAVGGSGEGPGEFAGLAQLVIDDRGHLHAFDSRHQRLTEWTDAGDLVGTTTFAGTPAGRRLGAVDRFDDGTWYGRETTRLRTTPDGRMARDTVGFFALLENEPIGRAITAVPGAFGTVMKIGGRGATRDVMYSPRALDARLGECLLATAGDEVRLRVFGSDGRLRGAIELPFPARETAASDRQAWIDGWIEEHDPSPRDAKMVEMMGRELEMAPRFPIANRIVADPAGYAWLERYAPPEGPSGAWVVVDGWGEIVAEPILPDGLELLGVGPDHVIGVGSDAFDRQEVRVHGLRRDPASRDTVLAECR